MSAGSYYIIVFLARYVGKVLHFLRSLLENVRSLIENLFGSVDSLFLRKSGEKLSFWKRGFSFIARVSWKTFVLEVWMTRKWKRKREGKGKGYQFRLFCVTRCASYWSVERTFV